MESSGRWGCNTYLIAADDRVFLIDPGPMLQLRPVARELKEAGRSPLDLTDVLLTHYDQDHTRSVPEWQRRTDATVRLGAADAELLRTRNFSGSAIRRFMVWLLRPPQLPHGTVELHGKVTLVPGLTALPTPGHTPGHYAFLWRDAALIGDAADTGPDGELVAFRRYMMTDPAKADATREMLSRLPVNMFCPSHSPAMERRGSPQPSR